MNANDLASLIPLALLLVFAYLVLIRPARRRAREVHSVQTALSAGDEVMLTSGIYGIVSGVGDERLTVQLAAGVEVEVARAAVAKILRDVPAEQAPDAPDAPASTVEDHEYVEGDKRVDSDQPGEGDQRVERDQPGAPDTPASDTTAPDTTASDTTASDEDGRGAR